MLIAWFPIAATPSAFNRAGLGKIHTDVLNIGLAQHVGLKQPSYDFGEWKRPFKREHGGDIGCGPLLLFRDYLIDCRLLRFGSFFGKQVGNS